MAVIQPLKALFTHTEGWSGTRMPNAPDGKAPLAFILDTTIFLGGMTVPAALVLLGASFARLKVGVRSKVRWRVVHKGDQGDADCRYFGEWAARDGMNDGW
jgi:hypothetical protein